jgi:hypothetical protein
MKAMPAKPFETALRIAVVVALALLAMARYGNVIVAAALPAFGWQVEALVPQLRIVELAVTRSGRDSVIHVDAAPAPVVMIGDKLLPLAPQSRFHVSTLSGHVYQASILALGILIAWPVTRRRRYLLRLALAVPALLALSMLDVPFVLAGELNDSLLELAAPKSFSPLGAWRDFLQGGGRLALAILAAFAVIAVAESGQSRATGALSSP